MAFDQTTRGRLQKLVINCRALLSDEFTTQLQQTYGLDPKTGLITPIERLTHLDDRQRHTADVLRQTLTHYLGSDSNDTDHRIAVLDRMVREQAFTVLNRLAALLMMEARGQLIESVSKVYQSRGFQLFSKIVGNAMGETGQAYQFYLFSVFDELAQELPALFDRYAANGLLFPRETSMRALLEELNHFEVEPLWAADETIGWIYQYFNSKEERKAMRDASQAPRNSRELAVRNQFFTPRYVVEFLVDNTLGRLWFNSTGGKTDLQDHCKYLLVKPDEQLQSAIKLRDPRTLKLLDPACGSMHFGLYAFDLFTEIYFEAWAWERQHGPGSLDVSTQSQAALKPLSQTYEDEAAFLRDVPRLIIEHNIYGVDIDPRAAQIATLALWLRAQRAWNDSNVKAKDRPRIRHSNIVAAVAPPAEREIRLQIASKLDRLDAEVFEKTLSMLKGLPEMGMLLQVEREMPNLIQEVYGKNTDLFNEQKKTKTWLEIESNLYSALNEFSLTAKSTYQGHLFAKDAIQGLRLIDLCREVFDVVVMNPPFGESTAYTNKVLDKTYPDWAGNILCCFIERMLQLIRSSGFVGVIFDRTVAVKSSYENHRRNILNKKITTFLDTGWNVLDANVETTCACLSSKDQINATFLDVRDSDSKAEVILDIVQKANNKFDYSVSRALVNLNPQSLLKLPNAVIGYDFPVFLLRAFEGERNLSSSGYVAYTGHQVGTQQHYRLWWELSFNSPPPFSAKLFSGEGFAPYWARFRDILIANVELDKLNRNSSTTLRNKEQHKKRGVCFGKRGEFFCAHILPPEHYFSLEGLAIPIDNNDDALEMLAILNTPLARFCLNKFAGQHKTSGYVNLFPYRKMSDRSFVISSIKKTLVKLRLAQRFDETNPLFEGLYGNVSVKNLAGEIDNEMRNSIEDIFQTESLCHAKVIKDYEVSFEERNDLEKFRLMQPKYECPIEDADLLNGCKWFSAHSILSFWVGVAFGRWELSPEISIPHLESCDPLSEIPVFPKIMSRNILNSNRPVGGLNKISDSHIFVDDPSHEKNITRVISDISRLLHSNHSASMEQEICIILGEDSLCSYFSKPTGFFNDHLKRYTKSGRPSPIYWPLSTSTGSYTLWVYYPSLNNQTLYTVINDFLDGPNGKLFQIVREVAELRMKGNGRSSEEDKQFEILQVFEQELTELRDKLLKIAPTYQPNHDDGVQITAAPLWQLFHHNAWQKVLKDTWARLEKGDCDWAHLAMAYWPDRVREKCKTDKSLAIAHGLEDLYIDPEAEPKKSRSKKMRGLINELG